MNINLKNHPEAQVQLSTFQGLTGSPTLAWQPSEALESSEAQPRTPSTEPTGLCRPVGPGQCGGQGKRKAGQALGWPQSERPAVGMSWLKNAWEQWGWGEMGWAGKPYSLKALLI